jgi:hypothetical protein
MLKNVCISHFCTLIDRYGTYGYGTISFVAHPHHFDGDSDPVPPFHVDANPYPTFHVDADPDPTFHFDADLDSDPTSHFDADTNPAPHQSYEICNTGMYRPSTAQF